ncbi:hypothetical protein FB451DRAFT_1412699 [Mycena latifolia]|nr:hypothetical protein FB451DRAFT_1412699 [Mycena latifolia]
MARAEWNSASTSAVQSVGGPPSCAAQQLIEQLCNDWEDDDDDCADADEEEPRAPADNQRIWDDACMNAQAPMPALIVSGRPAAPAPAAALPVGPGETLRDREVRYQEARERIFGKEAERGDGAKEGTGEGADKDKEKETRSGVARNPRGPQPANAAAQKGFKARSGRPPPASPVRGPDAAAV